MLYDDALALNKRALSIDTYDEAANYYYGLINNKLGNMLMQKTDLILLQWVPNTAVPHIRS